MMENKIIKFQVRTMYLYMKAKNMTAKQFKEVEEKVGLFDYIRDVFEWLRLVGDQEVINDLDSFIAKKSAKSSTILKVTTLQDNENLK